MWVKICGIQDPDTACMIADLGASALGLNFYSPSPRSIDVAQALKIKTAMSDRDTALVGLFVKHSLIEVKSVCNELDLKIVQLHGDEPPEFLAELVQSFPELKIIRAFRAKEPDLSPLTDFLTECDQCGKRPDYVLIDAYSPQAYGGTGHVAPWEMIHDQYREREWPPLILAGGLTPQNVAEAIQTVKPFGVDTASGVENAPGIKSQDMVKEFLIEAEKA
ncbi:phosphoribosylanthranilate isomerase [Gimesia fumaroli]|jgi:phosphoribosylanthranilate isomerase|uniref:N-(5'-phosphoribosyl)anthranilate isomerase n=1 Tax=Gimesia fumaroli TaxID=2527976 RepID=A0A518IEB0_9PLAN|nr:phosphoribosylanthranilate isomerase [Gimesia fumaroli]QDV51434.1 N-(5'-phosphoribosyl)anthranilate isomerase [Gimesia fumaroli]